MDDDLNDGKQQPESVAAVLKVFAILQALSERSDTGISELSVRLAMPKATVYRFLQTMKTLGYVRQETDSERYGLAMKAFELGAKALQYPDLVDLSKHHMQMLADATGETVHLGTLIDSEIIYVHKVDSKHMLGMYSRIGRRAPLHCTAIGKVLMAWEHPDRRARILEGMKVLLSGWGCVVTTAESVAACADMAGQPAEKPHAIIADYHLDDGTGIEAIAKIRLSAGEAIPALLVTADRSPEVRTAAERDGVSIQNKPVRPAAMPSPK